MERTAHTVALLVGSNPLPNYIAAVALQARHVVLFYSSETEIPCTHLKTALEKRTTKVSRVVIRDATDVRAIRDAWRTVSVSVDHVHYSGGTKPMAAHIRAACRLGEAQASYLDERKRVLRFAARRVRARAHVRLPPYPARDSTAGEYHTPDGWSV